MQPHLPLALLDKFGATAGDIHEGSFAITGASGREYGRFSVPEDPAAWAGDSEATSTTPGAATQLVLRALVHTDYAITSTDRDEDLSPVGRMKRLEQPLSAALETLVRARSTLADASAGLSQQEAQRYAPPAWDANNAATAITDWELRSYIRALPHAERGPIYEALTKGIDTPLLRAVLRSPIKLGNLEQMALDGWKSRIDADDMVGRQLLDIAKRSFDWAERNIATAQALTLQLAKFSPGQIFKVAGRDNAMRFFNFTPADVASIERQQVAQKFAAA